MKIVLAGGSGQLGTILARHFKKKKYDVVVLSRHASAEVPWRTVLWDARTSGPWQVELEGADAVINLTGKTINTRYTAENRRQILATRVESTQIVGRAIQEAAQKPRVWMNASASGIYRHSFEELFDETTTDLGGDGEPVPETWRFAAEVCKTWEKSFHEIETPGVRKIALRTTLALSPDRGGVFDLLLGLTRKGLGGRQGSGRQSISWMHDHDYTRAIEFLLEREEISGPVNMAAPSPIRNEDFMRVLREAAGVGFGLPAEEWMVKLGALAMRTEPWLVLKSVRAVPGVLEKAGFDFATPEWPIAARNLVRRWKNERGLN